MKYPTPCQLSVPERLSCCEMAMHSEPSISQIRHFTDGDHDTVHVLPAKLPRADFGAFSLCSWMSRSESTPAFAGTFPHEIVSTRFERCEAING